MGLPVEQQTAATVCELMESAASVDDLEALLMSCEQLEIPAEHRFVNGMYVREITIKKDTCLTSAVWLEGYVDIMLSGDISVRTPSGVKRLTGSNIMEGIPGRKRAGYAHEDTHWLTVHRALPDTPDRLMELMTRGTVAEYVAIRHAADTASFAQLLADMHLTDADIQAQVQNLDDQVCMPEKYCDAVHVLPSQLHGCGLFAAQSFAFGEHICPARIKGFRTPAGRYSNHSHMPNAMMILLDNDDMGLVAARAIERGQEITTDYRQTLVTRGLLCQA